MPRTSFIGTSNPTVSSPAQEICMCSAFVSSNALLTCSTLCQLVSCSERICIHAYIRTYVRTYPKQYFPLYNIPKCMGVAYTAGVATLYDVCKVYATGSSLVSTGCSNIIEISVALQPPLVNRTCCGVQYIKGTGPLYVRMYVCTGCGVDIEKWYSNSLASYTYVHACVHCIHVTRIVQPCSQL